MKQKITYLLTISSLYINAQVLYTENFDNYTPGIISSDLFGNIPGQGNWYVHGKGARNVSINDFTIEPENNKGNVAVINSTIKNNSDPLYAERTLKKIIQSNWYYRSKNHDILKYEYSIYIENRSQHLNNKFEGKANFLDICEFSNITLNNHTNILTVKGIKENLRLPTKQWVKIIAYLDYHAGVIYHEYPHINYTEKSNINIGTSTKHEIDTISFSLKGLDTNTIPYKIKIDDIIISAIEKLPKLYLSEFVSEKINIYPNPTSTIITIDKPDDLSITSIKIFNTEGKLIYSDSSSDKSKTLINVEKISNGNYTLHLETNNGLAIKSFIKK